MNDNHFDRKFNYFFIATLLVIAVLFIAITRLVEYRTNKALKDYSMLPNNVKVIDKVILGRSYPRFRYLNSKHIDYPISKLFRSGTIELVCTNQKKILLVMKEYINKYLEPKVSDDAYLFISSRIENGVFKKGEVKIQKITFLSRKYFDTIASDPLSTIEIRSIINALKERKNSSIDLYTFEEGNYFYGNTEVSKVKTFVNKCKQVDNY